MWNLDGHGLLLWQYYQMTMHLGLFHLIWYGYNLIILWLLDNSVIFWFMVMKFLFLALVPGPWLCALSLGSCPGKTKIKLNNR